MSKKSSEPLSETHPELIDEWDYVKNSPVTPQDVRAGSHNKYWWKCSKGHEWMTEVRHRAIRKTGCPYCSGHLIIVGETDLATTNPDLAREWNFEKNGSLKPTDVKAFTNKKVWWRDSLGHEWQMAISHRSIGEGCPVCGKLKRSNSHEKTMLNKNGSLLDKNPLLASEWHPTKNGNLTPNQVTASSAKKVWWKCLKGHEWISTVGNRTCGNGCPFCSNRKVLIGFNDLLSQQPKLAKEWDYEKNIGFGPEDVTFGSEKKVWWKCSKGHEWESTIVNRTRGNGCPKCGRIRGGKLHTAYFVEKNGSLLERYPQIAMEWNSSKNGDLTPAQVTANSYKKVWWKCSVGHEWESTVSNRTAGNGCPYCSNQRVLKGYNDLATVTPDLVKEWDFEKNYPLTPEEVTSGSNKKVWWKCISCGHEWCIQPSHRLKGHGCPVCGLQKRVAAHNITLLSKRGSLLNVYPQLASEWHPTKNGELLPSDFLPVSGKRIWWLGTCGHEWQMKISDRAKGNGCPICSGRRVLRGFNDLATVKPELVNEWDFEKNSSLTPYSVTSGSNKKAYWICSNGHSYQMKIVNRYAGHGCPYCAGQRILPGYNDFMTWARKNNPKLLVRWDYDRNGPVPEDESLSSDRMAWWKCDVCGYLYSNSIKNEHDSVLCPRCNKRNKTSFPEQTIYYYVKQLYPDAINGYSTQDVSEIDIYIPSINIGIEYDGKAWHDGTASYRKECKKYLACKKQGLTLIRFRENIKNVVPEDICDELIKSSYNESLNEFGKEIHLFLKRYGNIDVDIERDRNLIYDLYFTNIQERSLSHLFPNIAEEWDFENNKPITPDMVPAYSNDDFFFLCSKGHSYAAVVSKRTLRGDGCPYCSGRRTLRGFNDLFTTNPELKKEWDFEKNVIDPYEISKGHEKKVWWVCSKCKYSFFTSPGTRTSQGVGCPKCNGGVPLRVNQYDLNGNLIREFESLSQAGKCVGVVASAIGHACKKHTICVGFQWRYSNEVEGDIGEYRRKLINNKRVCQYDLNGNYIQTYESVTIAKEKTGASKIGEVCNGKRKQSGGFLWKYEGDYGEKNIKE